MYLTSKSIERLLKLVGGHRPKTRKSKDIKRAENCLNNYIIINYLVIIFFTFLSIVIC